jgi:tetratricopeptide (TPR) repeat protein
MAAILDHAINLAPNNSNLLYRRTLVDLASRGDIQPLKNFLRSLPVDKPDAAREYASEFLNLARYERDWDEATRMLKLIPSDGCRDEAFPFPHTWCEGLVARDRGDSEHARIAFSAAHAEVDKIVQQQPENGPALCVLGVIDAALGNRREAIQESKRAAELLPTAKDSINGAKVIQYLALTYALSGKKDAAFTELETAAKIPGYLSYGDLKLDPTWSSIRNDPRFENVLASFAPK